jgi:hypothetical protein
MAAAKQMRAKSKRRRPAKAKAKKGVKAATKTKSKTKLKTKSESKSKSFKTKAARARGTQARGPAALRQPRAAIRQRKPIPPAAVAPPQPAPLLAGARMPATAPIPALAPAAAPGGLAQITQIAAASTIAHYDWLQRGVAPTGYIQGMALVYARVYCKFNAGDAAAMAMAKRNDGNPATDALAWYAPEFAAAGMDNSADGVDTLRHVFVLLLGLGMRESSGQYCCGRDRSATNETADTAEAGAFQASWNASAASPLMAALFTQYAAHPSGFIDVFKQGVTCSAQDWQNWGAGTGAAYQQLCKTCPAFAAEFAGVGVRVLRRHWGTINSKAVEIRADADTMLRAVQSAVDATPGLCAVLQA